jgi:hypothetical protein
MFNLTACNRGKRKEQLDKENIPIPISTSTSTPKAKDSEAIKIPENLFANNIKTFCVVLVNYIPVLISFMQMFIELLHLQDTSNEIQKLPVPDTHDKYRLVLVSDTPEFIMLAACSVGIIATFVNSIPQKTYIPKNGWEAAGKIIINSISTYFSIFFPTLLQNPSILLYTLTAEKLPLTYNRIVLWTINTIIFIRNNTGNSIVKAITSKIYNWIITSYNVPYIFELMQEVKNNVEYSFCERNAFYNLRITSFWGIICVLPFKLLYNIVFAPLISFVPILIKTGLISTQLENLRKCLYPELPIVWSVAKIYYSIIISFFKKLYSWAEPELSFAWKYIEPFYSMIITPLIITPLKKSYSWVKLGLSFAWEFMNLLGLF